MKFILRIYLLNEVLGFEILAEIIERVSHQKYNVFLKENIFNPLKMKHRFDYYFAISLFVFYLVNSLLKPRNNSYR